MDWLSWMVHFFVTDMVMFGNGNRKVGQSWILSTVGIGNMLLIYVNSNLSYIVVIPSSCSLNFSNSNA